MREGVRERVAARGGPVARLAVSARAPRGAGMGENTDAAAVSK